MRKQRGFTDDFLAIAAHFGLFGSIGQPIPEKSWRLRDAFLAIPGALRCSSFSFRKQSPEKKSNFVVDRLRSRAY
jgi:hypothetical protein